MSEPIYTPYPGIEDFPYDEPDLHLVKKAKLHVSVIKRHAHGKAVTVGKIVDNRYYSLAKYQELFKRNGEPRGEPFDPALRKVRSYKRNPNAKTGRKKIHDLPSLDSIEDIPVGIPHLRVKMVRDIIYVASSRSYRDNGKQITVTKNLGRVVDGKFYTLDDYKTIFKPKRGGGRPRKNKAASSSQLTKSNAII